MRQQIIPLLLFWAFLFSRKRKINSKQQKHLAFSLFVEATKRIIPTAITDSTNLLCWIYSMLIRIIQIFFKLPTQRCLRRLRHPSTRLPKLICSSALSIRWSWLHEALRARPCVRMWRGTAWSLPDTSDGQLNEIGAASTMNLIELHIQCSIRFTTRNKILISIN